MDKVDSPTPIIEQPQPVPPVSPAKSSRWLKTAIIGGTVALALVGSVVYLIATKKSSPKQVACTEEAKQCPDGSYVGRIGPNCDFAPCPSPTPDFTANWKTYRDEKYGFEFKYPREGQILETDKNGECNVRKIEDTLEENPFNTYGNYFAVVIKSGYQSIDDYLKALGAQNLYRLENVAIIGADKAVFIGKQKSSLSPPETMPPLAYARAIFYKSGTIYEINYLQAATFPEGCMPSDNRQITQILSTFKFLPTSPTGGPETTPTFGGPRVCVQVITPAKNPQTGECRDFPTPCDVPEGWEKVGSCS